MAGKRRAKATVKKAAAKKPARKAVKVKAKAKKAAAPAKRVSPKVAKARKAARPAAKAAPQIAQPQYHTVTPVLTLNDAQGAIDFFRKAFGAEERMRMPGPEGKIAHAEIVIGDSVVMVSDAMDQPARSGSLHVYVNDCDALWDRAVAAGASVKAPLQDMFWGDRFGTVTDPFGNTWNIATHKEDVSPEEMSRRMAELPPPGSDGTTTVA